MEYFTASVSICLETEFEDLPTRFCEPTMSFPRYYILAYMAAQATTFKRDCMTFFDLGLLFF
jgi:hypothetical protein